jgi:hypothetical protein
MEQLLHIDPTQTNSTQSKQVFGVGRRHWINSGDSAWGKCLHFPYWGIFLLEMTKVDPRKSN